MYTLPPGPPRANMNPPVFQLAIRPLTSFPLPTAATIFRIVNIVSLCGCLWWLASTSKERWDLADVGALLAWAPMASMLSLNQLTWILWPLLLWAWWCWRQERWQMGAIGYGVALSLKPFLGVFLLWLLVTRRWRAAAVAVVSAAATFAVGLAVYGVDVTRAWLEALGGVTWASADMNASLQGVLARTLTKPSENAAPLVVAPGLVAPMALAGAVLILVVTLSRTRQRSIEESWLPLMIAALLASPLGWLYYFWWILPGTRPSRLLFASPLLFVPWGVMTMLQPAGWLTLTLGSVYFWGLAMLWWSRMRSDHSFVS
jgi:alpha-1,2-mannosyltransferase